MDFYENKHYSDGEMYNNEFYREVVESKIFDDQNDN
jgi:hypothetical protein